MDLEGIRRRLLDARDARALLTAALQADLRQRSEQGFSPAQCGATVFLSLNVPGPDKSAPGLERVFARGRSALLRELSGCTLLAEGRDALGPYGVVAAPGSPHAVKLACVRLEMSLPFGRLLDLDVLAPDGTQVDRASIGLPPRRCLVCESPAVDCIRAARHSPGLLASAVRRLARARLDTLARALVDGARAELDLTPKPGLVDRLDNGSHPDLSYERMARSIDTLPRYYDDLIDLSEPEPLDLGACVAAGMRAEERMQAAAGSNTHRGYIFLSGLLLLAAAADVTGTTAGWREQVRALARRLMAQGSRPRELKASHGENARRRHGAAGIFGEALAGLPSVFDHGLHALARGSATLGSTDAARHYVMAVLMTTVEDTTAIHRCGPAGLARLKEDGARLASLIEKGGDYLAALSALNDEYRAMRLTMGGIADCLALTIAVGRAGTD